ncbi:hypothetical protein AUP68_10375 [Ilyonectria robusta]
MSILSDTRIPDDYDTGISFYQEEDEDGLGGYISPPSIDEQYLKGRVDEDYANSQAREQQQSKWRITHSSGSFKMDRTTPPACSLPHYSVSLVSMLIYRLMFIVADFIAKTSDPDFNSAQALDMLQRSYTMNYGSRKMGSTPAREDNTYFPRFRLDFISIVSQPLRSICRHSHFFDNITISLRHWQAPYSAKHVEGIPFDLAGCTFRLATGATREAWFVVMHPIQATPPRPNARHAGWARQGSALARHYAENLEQETCIQAHHQDLEYDSDKTDRENNGGREEVDEEGEDAMEASNYSEPDLSYQWSAPDSQHEPREAIDPMLSEITGASPESIAAAPLADMSPTSDDQDGLYSDGLGQLHEALE